MSKSHLSETTFNYMRRVLVSTVIVASLTSVGCTTNYLTNSTTGTYGVPVTERTIPQRLLDRSIEHTAKVNVYGLQQNLQQNSRMSIDSFNSEVLLTGEVPTEAIKAQIEQVLRSMPDVRQVYNELQVGVARGYSSTVQDGYITSKLLAKVAASDGVKSSQIKAVTDNGVVYVLGRMTPTQQGYLIDIANDTAGVVEMVLLTTLVNDTGRTITDQDIMSEPNLGNTTERATIAPTIAVVRTAPSTTNAALVSPVVPIDASPSNLVIEDRAAEPNTIAPPPASSSPYIDLYKDP